MNNNRWAHCLIDQLIQQGVVDFCIAPGSRSTALALAIARHPKARWQVHFDERGLGFYALGMSQATQRATAIIVTSGTAVGNLLPAVMEAYHSHIPLIILTADRPSELRDTSASQTTDQVKIFSHFVLWQADLSCPCDSLNEDFIRSQSAYAVFQSMKMGPIHLNCQFREPLFAIDEPQREGALQPQFFPDLAIDAKTIQYCETLLQQAKRGLILIGALPPQYDLSHILSFAHKLHWPICADLLSQVRCHKTPEELFINYDWAILWKMMPQPDLILHFGGTFISKALLEWTKQINAPTIHVHAFPERIDPLHLRPTKVYADPTRFCQPLSIIQKSSATWLDEWNKIDIVIGQYLDNYFSQPRPFTEANLMRSLGEQLPDSWSCFFSNSMPIRDANHFFFPRKPKSIFANRGLAGIDGQIATAAGIASALQTPILAVLGDQSSLYDLNSLSLLRKIHSPFLLVISNNFGGGIFSHLPISDEKQYFEPLFGAPHPWCFDKAAEMFDIPYRRVESDEWGEIFHITCPFILEVITSRQDNHAFHKKLREYIGHVL